MALADILGPLVDTAEHYVKNSKDFIKYMAENVIEEEEMFNTHDAVSPSPTPR